MDADTAAGIDKIERRLTAHKRDWTEQAIGLTGQVENLKHALMTVLRQTPESRNMSRAERHRAGMDALYARKPWED